MFLQIAKFSLFIFVFLSGITITYGEPGKGILGRLAIPDIFGLLFLFFFLLRKLVKGEVTLISTALIKYLYFFLFYLFVGALLASKNITSSFIEILVLSFELLLITFAFEACIRDNCLKKIILAISFSVIFVSIYGIYDLIAEVTGLPVLIKKQVFSGCASSTFRNCGQAGAFVLVYTFILIATYNSELIHEFSKFQKKVIFMAITLGIMLLLLTVKVASYIGFFVGIFLFLLLNLKRKKIKSIGYFFVLLLFLVVAFKVFSHTSAFKFWHSWYTYKIHDRMKEVKPGDKDSFLYHNWSLALKALEDNPLLGSGLGGFNGVYDKYEIHSTPVKFLGECGIVGFVLYLVFLYMLIYGKFIKVFKYRDFNKYANFLYNLFPLLLGLLANWVYTYHFRKREFWVLLLIIELSNYYMRRSKINGNRRKNNEVFSQYP